MLVQYIVLRKDLLPKSNTNWTWGAIIAQACHASSACLFKYQKDPHVVTYVKDWQNMHKVILQAPDDSALRKLSEDCKGLDMLEWIEQPENILTALAFKPYPKEEIHPFLKHLPLLR